MRDLTKWPRLLVVGEPVTEQQANDILVRTFDWSWFHTNDRIWKAFIERLAADILGRPIEPPAGEQSSESRSTYWDGVRAWQERMGILDLHYLGNDMIASSWLGGPQGWCDWDGTIGCANYNIGKWPSTDAVTEDLTSIATAWPFLTMRVQLLSDEGTGQLLNTWTVSDGHAELVEDATLIITEPKDLPDFQIITRLTSPFGERGVSAERLHAALIEVAAARKDLS